MDTSISELSSVDYAFDLKATAEDLASDIEKEMRKYRSGLSLKGFRPGKVPLTIVKKMYGKAIALDVVEKALQAKFEEAITGEEAYDVLGAPKMVTFEYEPFGDLHAVINFGVKPEVELQDMGGEEVIHVTHEVDEAEIDEEIEDHRKRHAEQESHTDPAGEADTVACDIQRLDLTTDTPVIGERQENTSVFLGNPDVLPELKTALTGVTKGDVTKVTLPAPEGETADPSPRRFELTVVDVTRQILPEIDEAFVSHATGEKGKTMDDLRQWTREHLEERWVTAIREDFQSGLMKGATKLHQFDVPNAAVESYLDNYIKELERQSESGLPESFDSEGFRESQRGPAEEAVRWQLIRDRIIEIQELVVSPEDMDLKFEEMGKSREVAGDVMRRILEAYNPDGIAQIEKGILDEKVFDFLASSFKVTEKPFEDVYGEEKPEEKTED
jgi:trigger factor